jgi:hypothetical protein
VLKLSQVPGLAFALWPNLTSPPPLSQSKICSPLLVHVLPSIVVEVSPRSHAHVLRLSRPVGRERTVKREDDEFIDGLFEESKADKWNNLNDPSTQSLLSRVPETAEEFERAVVSAKKAFESWRRTSMLTRQKFALE